MDDDALTGSFEQFKPSQGVKMSANAAAESQQPDMAEMMDRVPHRETTLIDLDKYRLL